MHRHHHMTLKNFRVYLHLPKYLYFLRLCDFCSAHIDRFSFFFLSLVSNAMIHSSNHHFSACSSIQQKACFFWRYFKLWLTFANTCTGASTGSYIKNHLGICFETFQFLLMIFAVTAIFVSLHQISIQVIISSYFFANFVWTSREYLHNSIHQLVFHELLGLKQNFYRNSFWCDLVQANINSSRHDKQANFCHQLPLNSFDQPNTGSLLLVAIIFVFANFNWQYQ